MTAITYREGQDCPSGCGDPIIRCDCDDSGPDGHLICLGCGEDAGGCDCLGQNLCETCEGEGGLFVTDGEPDAECNDCGGLGVTPCALRPPGWLGSANESPWR